MRTAFKEWAIIVDALARGEQIVILRKGGIHEGRGGFKADHSEFLLFPTRFHQQRESVVPTAQARFDELEPTLPPPDLVRIEFLARVVDSRRLDSLAGARRLRGQHLWREDVIAARFDWGRQKSIHALAVRVYRLPSPVELPIIPAYTGCKSWVELEQETDVTQATPVLNDQSFARRLASFREALPASVTG
jgi:hypothetical protein